MEPVTIFDSTLRDGAQGTGIAFSLEDKLQAVRLLDQVGVQYVEAGNPGSNPKDEEFFRQASALPLRNAKLSPLAAPGASISLPRRTRTCGPFSRLAPLAAAYLESAGNFMWIGCWKPPMRKISA